MSDRKNTNAEDVDEFARDMHTEKCLLEPLEEDITLLKKHNESLKRQIKYLIWARKIIIGQRAEYLTRAHKAENERNKFKRLVDEIEKIILTTQHTYADGVKVIEIYSLIEKFKSDNDEV